MMKTGILAVGAFSVVMGVAGAEKIPSASELLDRYTQALDSVSSFIDEYENTCDASYVLHSGASFKGRGFERGQVRFDGKRFYRHHYKWGDYNNREMDLPESKAVYGCLIENIDTVYSHNKRLGQGFGTLHRHTIVPRNPSNVLRYTFNLSYVMGYVNCSERLDHVLKQAERIAVRGKTDEINGSDCFVLQAETKCGHYTLWLDPAHGCHPAKVMHDAGEGKLVDDHQLKKGETAKAYVKDVRFEQIDGIWVPMEAKAGDYNKSTDGVFLKQDHHYRRTRVVLNPDHAKLGSFADPLYENPANDPELVDGTRVRLEREHKLYIWRGGKLAESAENH